MPSEAVLETKKAKVESLTKLLNEATAGVLADYKGITVEADTKLRRELRAEGINYFVEKNSMLRLAFRGAGLDQLEGVLEGTTSIALTTGDQTAPARILGKFADGSKGKFSLKAGFIDKEVYDQKGVNALSKIPSKEVLLAQLVGSLQGPIQKLAATLKALADQKSEQSA